MHALSILLVEHGDEDAEIAIRALLKSRLTKDIVRLRSGTEAQSYLLADEPPASGYPDLILMDWMLPQRNGIDVLRCIKSQPLLNTVRVVMLLSAANEKQFVESHNVTADGYLIKPLNEASFRSLVAAL